MQVFNTSNKRSRRRPLVRLEDGSIISLLICRSCHTRMALRRWLLRVIRPEREFSELLCLMNPENNAIEAIHLMPNIPEEIKYFKWLKPDDPWFGQGYELRDFSDLQSVISGLKAQATLGQRISQ